jgi:hypothetical protein
VGVDAGHLDCLVERLAHRPDRDLRPLVDAARQLDELIDQVLAGNVDDRELVGGAADVDADDEGVRVQGRSRDCGLANRDRTCCCGGAPSAQRSHTAAAVGSAHHVGTAQA